MVLHDFESILCKEKWKNDDSSSSNDPGETLETLDGWTTKGVQKGVKIATFSLVADRGNYLSQGLDLSWSLYSIRIYLFFFSLAFFFSYFSVCFLSTLRMNSTSAPFPPFSSGCLSPFSPFLPSLPPSFSPFVCPVGYKRS